MTGRGRGIPKKPDAASPARRRASHDSPPVSPRERTRSRSPLSPVAKRRRDERHRDPTPPPMDIPEPPQPQAVPITASPNKRVRPKTGALEDIALSFSEIQPCRERVIVTLDTQLCVPYFTSLRAAILSRLYPGSDGTPDNIINEAHFNLVCRYLMKSRIDNVYGKVTGIRQAGRIPVPMEVVMPKALADLINNIGRFTARHGGIVFVPRPEIQPPEAHRGLLGMVDADMMAAFNRLVMEAYNAGHINVGTISMMPDGTPYWHTTVHTPQAVVAEGNATVVYVKSIYPDFTPADAMMAAILQNRSTGLTVNDLELGWSTNVIRGINDLRTKFNLKA